AEPIALRSVLAPQVQHVLEAVGADEGRARALALEQGVRGHGCAVREPLELDRFDRRGRREHRLLLPPRGRNLGRPQLVLVREQNRIRERAADVDAKDGHVNETTAVSAWSAEIPLETNSGAAGRRPMVSRPTLLVTTERK